MKILFESYMKEIQHKKEKAAFGIVRGFVFFRNPSLHWAAEYTIWHKGDIFAKYTTMIWQKFDIFSQHTFWQSEFGTNLIYFHNIPFGNQNLAQI